MMPGGGLGASDSPHEPFCLASAYSMCLPICSSVHLCGVCGGRPPSLPLYRKKARCETRPKVQNTRSTIEQGRKRAASVALLTSCKLTCWYTNHAVVGRGDVSALRGHSSSTVCTQWYVGTGSAVKWSLK
jgi:hypothetical protein